MFAGIIVPVGPEIIGRGLGALGEPIFYRNP